uniref:EGF-like domain-containing protein n=1 Tax=Ditylenchus dipsaci TaxID=166011 RepID=A0A915D911_9BILA
MTNQKDPDIFKNSQNIFQDEAACVETCETPNDTVDLSSRPIISLQESLRENQLPSSPKTTSKPIIAKSIEKAIKPTITPPASTKGGGRVVVEGQDVVLSSLTVLNKTVVNICETSNPCLNNGTCVFDRSKESFYYCRCARGYTNDNCSEKSDFDPCSSSSCLNGGTCSAKAEKIKSTFECFCTKGFAGVHCELRPCDDKPCQNNGTCRTTKGNPPFFCECTPEWGGRHCAIEIPQDPNIRKYGTSVQLLSSGKVEWIEEMQKSGPTEQAMSNPKSRNHVNITADITNREEHSNNATSVISSGGATRRSSSTTSGNIAPMVGGETPTRTLSKSIINGAYNRRLNGAIKILISIYFYFTLIAENFNM